MLTVGILNKAIECAKKSKMKPHRIGCVCFRGKRILSLGFNQIRSSEGIPIRYKRHAESLHAEQHAIMRIKNKELLHGASILVIRVTYGGRLSMARPCNNCLNTILHFKFKEMYFSGENGEIVWEKLTY